MWRYVPHGILVTTIFSGAASAQNQAASPARASDSAANPTFSDVVVVTPSRTEEGAQRAPASIAVITADAIATAAVRTVPELLASTPGMNVIQTSARDFNVTSRGTTKVTANTQLVLVDGRSVYQDFLGFVLWDGLQITLDEIAQIEVIRGPASAVWGANAMDGVVNILTRSPRELAATTGGRTSGVDGVRSTLVSLETGLFDRGDGSEGNDVGGIASAAVTHAAAVNTRLAYKVSAAFTAQDSWSRPTGTMQNLFQTPYPAFDNSGTAAPKVNARIDYSFPDSGRTLVLGGGFAGINGIMHTGSGPFQIQDGSAVSYIHSGLTTGQLKLSGFVNVTSGDANSLLSVDAAGRPVLFRFESQTYDVDVAAAPFLTERHNIRYGGNARYSRFDLTVAPLGRSRGELGGYLQDHITLNDRVEWLVGGRLDKLGAIDRPVFSPRSSLVVSLPAQQVLRASVNRAYRSPTLVNNYLDLTLATSIDLGVIVPALSGQTYGFSVATVGNRSLQQESVTSYEVAYSRIVGARLGEVTASYYLSQKKNSILLGQTSSYTSASPPPSWPLPLSVLDALNAVGAGLPAVLTDVNWGRFHEQGVELSGEGRVYGPVRASANYAWQKAPSGDGPTVRALNVPPTHHVNVRVIYDHDRYYSTLGVQYVSAALWRDVLDARYHGPTEAWTRIDVSGGVRWAQGNRVLAVNLVNLTNRSIQHHIFGDILKRQAILELRIRL